MYDWNTEPTGFPSRVSRDTVSTRLLRHFRIGNGVVFVGKPLLDRVDWPRALCRPVSGLRPTDRTDGKLIGNTYTRPNENRLFSFGKIEFKWKKKYKRRVRRHSKRHTRPIFFFFFLQYVMKNNLFLGGKTVFNYCWRVVNSNETDRANNGRIAHVNFSNYYNARSRVESVWVGQIPSFFFIIFKLKTNMRCYNTKYNAKIVR